MRNNSVVSAALIAFVGVFAVVIGYRIDQQTLIIITGVATGFFISAIAIGLIAFFVIRKNRTANHAPPTIADTRPYHIQHPLPPQAQLPAAGPRYDESVKLDLRTAPRTWVAVDEVNR